MWYQTTEIKDGKIVITSSKEIDQRKLTSDCWLIQFSGLSACKDCPAAKTADCGGGETLKRLTKGR